MEICFLSIYDTFVWLYGGSSTHPHPINNLSSTQWLNLKLSIVMSEDYFCLTIDYGESFMILSICYVDSEMVATCNYHPVTPLWVSAAMNILAVFGMLSSWHCYVRYTCNLNIWYLESLHFSIIPCLQYDWGSNIVVA